MRNPRRLQRGLVLIGLVLLLGYPVSTVRGLVTGTTTPVDSAITEAIVVPMNQFAAYTFTLTTGEALLYSIEVTDGGAIDVYLVPSAGLTKYESGLSSIFDRYQEFPNQRAVSGSLPDVMGEVAVIVDNTNVSGAQSTGAVSASVALSKSSNTVLGGILLILCGVGALAAAAIIFAVRRRKARTTRLAFAAATPLEVPQEPETLPSISESDATEEPPRP